MGDRDPYGEHRAYKVIAADRNAYDHSPLRVEMYGVTHYADAMALRARDCLLPIGVADTQPR